MSPIVAINMSTASVTLQEALRKALNVCCGNLERARLLVSDAVANLMANFLKLSGVIDRQHVVLTGIKDSLRLAGKGDGFTGAAIQLVNEFVDQVVRVSHDSMRIIDQLATTGDRVNTIVEHADDIDDLARETRFIAINARIETQRAGDSGRTFRVVAEEVRRLAKAASELSARIRQEVTEAHASLQITHRTAASLAGHDMSTAIVSRGTIVGAIEKLADVNANLQDTLATIGQMVDDTVRALQFEDMVAQLLVDSAQRLRTLENLSADLFDAATPDGPERAARLSQELVGLARPPSVSQQTVEKGSVDLF